MENFFVDDHFCPDLESLANHLDIDEENVNDLPEDWKIEVAVTSQEKIFTFKIDDILDSLFEMNEDRFPEDPDNTIDKIKAALIRGINEEVVNNNMPSLWYPNGEVSSINKADLVEHFK